MKSLKKRFLNLTQIELFFIIIISSFITSCAKKPTVITTAVTNIHATSAMSGGSVTTNGRARVTVRGVCWSTAENPTLADSKTIDGSGIGNYESNLSGLTANTTYYLRAYATNRKGTGYGEQVNFKTGPDVVTDVEGNNYLVVQIGTQHWMAENFRSAKYNDGTPIPLVSDNTKWSALSSGACCWVNNDQNTYLTYAVLYNRWAVNSNKLCPSGWHIPTNEDWSILTDYLGGMNIAGGKMKETGTAHWMAPNTGATNESGFTALPTGRRLYTGNVINFQEACSWWHANVVNNSYNIIGYLLSNSGGFYNDNYLGNDGVGVRCIQN